ncbi:MAG: hypothetical protein ACAH95_13700 [Fimbriimonas sp.]
MILQVPFDEFPKTLERVLEGCKDVYLSRHQQQTLVTASKQGLPVVAAMSPSDMEGSRAALMALGFNVFEGRWNSDLALGEEGDDLTEIYVAGVAYRTESGPPGLWMDAYAVQPTQVQVLKSMYDEMTSTGQMAEVSFEEFVRLSESNVVVAGPNDLRSFLALKEALPSPQ